MEEKHVVHNGCLLKAPCYYKWIWKTHLQLLATLDSSFNFFWFILISFGIFSEKAEEIPFLRMFQNPDKQWLELGLGPDPDNAGMSSLRLMKLLRGT